MTNDNARNRHLCFLGEPDRPRFLWRRSAKSRPGGLPVSDNGTISGMLESSSSAREPDGGMPNSKTVSQRMVPRLFALLQDRCSIYTPTNIDSVPRVLLISIDSPLGWPEATSGPTRTEKPMGWGCPWEKRGVRRGIFGRRSRPPCRHRPTTTGNQFAGGLPEAGWSERVAKRMSTMASLPNFTCAPRVMTVENSDQAIP